MKRLLAILSTVATLMLVSSAYGLQIGGSGVGNGTDDLDPTQVISWFLEKDRPIYWCVDVENNQSFQKPIEEAFERALGVWSSYLERKKLFVGAAAKTIPSMKYKLQANCDSPDLRIIMGSNPLAAPYLAQYENPISFVQVTEVESYAWRKGVLWIKESNPEDLSQPNWNIPYTLQGLLTHELGHLLGVEHVSMTIMDRDFKRSLLPAPSLLLMPALRQLMMTQIDHYHELFYCSTCTRYVWGFPEGDSARGGMQRSRSSLESIFKLFAPTFDPADYELRLGLRQEGETFALLLMARDSASIKKVIEVPLQVQYQVHEMNRGEAKIFKSFDENGNLLFFRPSFKLFQANAKGADNKEYPIKISINGDQFGQIGVEILLNGEFQYLYSSSTLGGADRHYQELRKLY